MAWCLRWSFAQAALKNRALNLDGLHCQAMTQSQHKLFQKWDVEFKSLICNECILIATSQACARFGKCKVFRHIKRWRWPLAIFGIRIRIDLYFPAAGKGLAKPILDSRSAPSGRPGAYFSSRRRVSASAMT